jgi:hypothetical protein
MKAKQLLLAAASLVILAAPAYAAATDSGLDTPAAGTPLKFAVGGVQVMHMTQTGLGIKTTSVTHALDVVGDAVFSGDVYAAAYLYNSDMRLKEHIRPSKGLDIIAKLNGVTFDWKDGGRASAGLLAQDVEKVMPVAVRVKSDGMKAIEYGPLMAPMVEAIKELKAQNDRMATEIDALRAEIADMKK